MTDRMHSREYRQTLPVILNAKGITQKGINNNIPIMYIQLDPNGLCNAKCWFCPVAYEGNPKSAQVNMPIEMMEDILKQLNDGRGDFVEHNAFIVPYNFNEVLLYPHFEQMLQLFQKYNFKMPISTNAVNLTKNKIDLIKQYPDVVVRILLNVPSAFKDDWSKQTGFNAKLFDKTISNIRYAIDELPHLIVNKKISFIFNHITKESLDDETGWVELMENSPIKNLDVENDYSEKTINEFAKIFPEIDYIEKHEVLDRLGFLDRIGIFTNAKYRIRDIKKNKTNVIGCDFDGDSQTEFSMHINGNGDVHLCCQDFNFESVYANVKDKTIKEIWHSQEKRDAINQAYKTFCRDCQYAVWE